MDQVRVTAGHGRTATKIAGLVLLLCTQTILAEAATWMETTTALAASGAPLLRSETGTGTMTPTILRFIAGFFNTFGLVLLCALVFWLIFKITRKLADRGVLNYESGKYTKAEDGKFSEYGVLGTAGIVLFFVWLVAGYSWSVVFDGSGDLVLYLFDWRITLYELYPNR